MAVEMAEYVVLCGDKVKEGLRQIKEGRKEHSYLLSKILQGLNHKYLDIREIDLVNKDDVIFVHLDKTVLSEDEIAEIQKLKNEHVFNKGIVNIKKRNIEKVSLELDFPKIIIDDRGSYSGQVIVKSDFNCKDGPQYRYDVMEIDEVSEKDWNDENVVVEKFVASNKAGMKKLDRYIIFLGEVIICSLYSEGDVIKNKTCMKKEYKALNHDMNKEKILNLAKKLKLDYGSIDTVTDENGELYVLDVNKTTRETGIPDVFLDTFREKLNL